MKNLIICLLVFLLFFGCSRDDDERIADYALNEEAEKYRAGETLFDSVPENSPHRKAALKILAIGNSFTNNSCQFLPRLVHELNQDSVCIAKLTCDGSSLQDHWKAHIANSPIYSLKYSDGGDWHEAPIHTLDMALASLDWDVIVIQQVSYLAGDYSSYQPWLNRMVSLLRYTHPHVKMAWHYTWAYRAGTTSESFKKYDFDPVKMHSEIIKCADRASAEMPLRIYSATLINDMRAEFTEVEDAFSSDGIHITDRRANYALSLLWYETLIAPFCDISALSDANAYSTIPLSDLQRILPIISSVASSGKVNAQR